MEFELKVNVNKMDSYPYSIGFSNISINPEILERCILVAEQKELELCVFEETDLHVTNPIMILFIFSRNFIKKVILKRDVNKFTSLVINHLDMEPYMLTCSLRNFLMGEGLIYLSVDDGLKIESIKKALYESLQKYLSKEKNNYNIIVNFENENSIS